ncbi:MAG: hypothetical protein WD401_04240 [Thermomicrobiaceae bacterium]
MRRGVAILSLGNGVLFYVLFLAASYIDGSLMDAFTFAVGLIATFIVVGASATSLTMWTRRGS